MDHHLENLQEVWHDDVRALRLLRKKLTCTCFVYTVPHVDGDLPQHLSLNPFPGQACDVSSILTCESQKYPIPQHIYLANKENWTHCHSDRIGEDDSWRRVIFKIEIRIKEPNLNPVTMTVTLSFSSNTLFVVIKSVSSHVQKKKIGLKTGTDTPQ